MLPRIQGPPPARLPLTLSCNSSNLAKTLGEGTSRGATEKSVAPFTFDATVAAFYQRLAPNLGEPSLIYEVPN